MTTLKVGQKLYWVPSARWHMDEQEVTVEKVGRKWATIAGGRYRIDVQTLQADAGSRSSPGRCYLDKESFLAKRAAHQAWGDLQNNVRFSYPPEGVTAEDIRQAMKLLKIGAEP